MLRRRIVGAGCYFHESAAVGTSHDGGASSSGIDTSSSVSTLLTQKRFSLHYTNKAQLTEMSQPDWLHDKRWGMYSYHTNISSNYRTVRTGIRAKHRTHMNMWDGDTDATNNRFFRPYWAMQKDYHDLLGRQSYLETEHVDRRMGLSDYELNNDMTFKGIDRPAMTNAYYESPTGWAKATIYRSGAHGAQLSNPNSELTRRVLGDELIAIRDQKSGDECKAWWDRLKYLVDLHHKSVGDIGDYTSRNIQHVHRFFVAFHDAMSSFDFQDRYLASYVKASRPKELDDIFGIFLEMEANYIHEDHCPRCSLPLATTRFCGEGDPDTPYRKHRGRWAPHQQWGKEWYEVVCRRAEALWYRSTEDEYFGGAQHTQRQAEALMLVYLKTKQRGKALDFINNLRGSKEFVTGSIVVSPTMQKNLDTLLDTTPHPHVLTNAIEVKRGSEVYLAGEVRKAPQSPQQFRLDMEMNKFRRMQREEGVVRLPPTGWSIDTKSIVDYKIGEDGHVANWREVRASIEASFASTGLKPEAYSKDEWREMYHLTDSVSRRDTVRERAERELADETARLGTHGYVFPDATWYRCFDTSAASLAPFQKLTHGVPVRGVLHTFSNPRHVVMTTGANQTLTLDTSVATLQCFNVHYGEQIIVSGGTEGLQNAAVMIVGVELGGSNPRELLGALVTDPDTLVPLGKDILDMRSRWSSIQLTGRYGRIPYAPANVQEEYIGCVVGVRKGVLYCQWGQNVATPVTPDMEVFAYSANTANTNSGGKQQQQQQQLVEPFSWATPFRNNWAEERLEELRKAPWNRERWVSLIPGKFTPKPKKFGYTQHTTQDDFVTKEYRDRVTSRQYFHSPNSFEIIPDASTPSVNFQSKQESIPHHGLPTVDRRELEDGWAPVSVISDAEAKDIEQCIKDISGNRPGNFIKSSTESSALRLNESWWQPLEYGWEQHNREQSLLHSTERKIKDASRLPFKGKLPPFGETFGIAERIRDIGEDYSKGFGLGPHMMSPSSDRGHFNTLGVEDNRVANLGYGNVLVRLFDEKIGLDDPAQVLLSASHGSQHQLPQNVRHLLLSLQEWREFGAPPSAPLRHFLKSYLADEIVAYNAGIPHGVAPLSVDANPAVLTPTRDNVWASTDRIRYALDYLKTRATGASTSGEYSLVLGAVIQAQTQAVNAVDEHFLQHVYGTVSNDFQTALAAIANKGIDLQQLVAVMQKKGPGGGGSGTSSIARKSQAVPMVASHVLDELLQRFGITEEERRSILSLLVQHPDADVRDARRFIVPISVVTSWKADQAGAVLSSKMNHSATKRTGVHSTSSALSGGSTATPNRSMDGTRALDSIIDELPSLHDGLAMDVQYAIREHTSSAAMREEFQVAWSGYKTSPNCTFEKYVTGRFVPSADELANLFCHFLRRAADDHKLAEEYFVVDARSGKAVDVRVIPTDPVRAEGLRTFSFENVRSDVRSTDAFVESAGATMSRFVESHRPIFTAHKDKLTFAVTSGQTPTIVCAPLSDAREALTKAIAILRPHLHSRSPTLFAAICEHPDTTGMMCLEHFVRRTMPCLIYFHRMLQRYIGSTGSLRTEATNSSQTMANILQNERSTVLENDFRRNAERYWKMVLDGRGLDELTAGGGRGGGRMGGGAPRGKTISISHKESWTASPQTTSPSSSSSTTTSGRAMAADALGNLSGGGLSQRGGSAGRGRGGAGGVGRGGGASNNLSDALRGVATRGGLSRGGGGGRGGQQQSSHRGGGLGRAGGGGGGLGRKQN